MIVAEDLVTSGVTVSEHGKFSNVLRLTMKITKPLKIIETGTYDGLGTTLSILMALSDAHGKNSGWKFITIEINPDLCLRAGRNLGAHCIPVSSCEIRNQLSVDSALLPSEDEIQKKFVEAEEHGAEGCDIVVDHHKENRARLYFGECSKLYKDGDNGLLRAINEFDGCPDFVLLDSAGHIGKIEFDIFCKNVKGKCLLALDDVFHVKHNESYNSIKEDPRFRIMAIGREKFGWLIAEFNP